MGGAICAGDPWAAESKVGGNTSSDSKDDLPVLRMSLQIGEGDTPLLPGKPSIRQTSTEIVAWAPLRLARSIGPAPAAVVTGGTAAQPRPAVAVVRAFPIDIISVRSSINDDEAPPQPSAPVPFDPTPSGPVTPRPQTTQDGPTAGPGKPGPGLPDLSGESWTMAPIRWQGNSTTSGTLFNDEHSSNYGVNNGLALGFNSFIVAPYIATWAGNFGLNSTSFRSIPDVGPTTKSDSSGHNVGGNINVFPVSNFPFSAYFARGDFEFSSGKNRNVPNSSTAFGFEQQYRTADGRDKYSARYDRNSISSGNNEGSSSTMQGSFSTRRIVAPDQFFEGEHALSANIVYSPPSTSVAGEGGQSLNTSITHNWRVHEDLSINNLLSVNDTQTKQFQGNTLTSNDNVLILGSSTFNWRPDEDWPLDIGGGANLGYTQTQNTDAPQTSQNFFSASLSANYRYSNQLSISAGAAVATATTDTGRFNQAYANAAAYYTGLPIQFGPYTYGWSAGAGVNANVGNQGNSGAGANASAGHNVSREFVIDERQGASITAGQNLAYNLIPNGGSAVSLSNSVGASWRASYGDALSGSLGASAGFTTGSDSNNAYTASLIGNGNYLISSRQSLSFNANVNWTRTETSGSNAQPQVLNQTVIDNNQTQMTGIVSVNYAHTSPFSIRNLSYTADLLWVGNQSNQRLVGAGTVSSGNGTSLSLQQMLRYRIGRLSFNLSASVIDAGGVVSNSVFGSVTRDFDGFFDGRW
jgi:hypothetical protein